MWHVSCNVGHVIHGRCGIYHDVDHIIDGRCGMYPVIWAMYFMVDVACVMM